MIGDYRFFRSLRFIFALVYLTKRNGNQFFENIIKVFSVIINYNDH